MMADINENAVWEAGIRLIETTDPVIGGAPNPGTGAGMVNIPHLELANRTAWLREQAYAGVMAWDSTRTYAAGDTVAHAGRLWLATVNSTDSEPTSSSVHWSLVWSAEDAPAFKAAAGYQILPSGLIFQWGSGGPMGANQLRPTTYPIAFTSVVYSVPITGWDGWAGTAGRAQSVSQFSVKTGSEAITGYDWFAIGV